MGQIKVRAKKLGYMFNRRVKEGEVFMVDEDKASFDRTVEQFDRKSNSTVSAKHYGWMERVEEATPVTEVVEKEDPHDRTPLAHELNIV